MISKHAPKKLLIVISLISGLIIGYICGYFRVIDTLFLRLRLIRIDFSSILKLLNFNPNPTSLSDIAAFEAAIMAFLIPLSIELVSKLSDQYQSAEIVNSFEEGWVNKILPYLLMSNIVLSISLRFFSNDVDLNCHAWNILAICILFSFIIIAILILVYLNQVKQYLRDTQYILNQLEKAAIDAFDQEN